MNNSDEALVKEIIKKSKNKVCPLCDGKGHWLTRCPLHRQLRKQFKTMGMGVAYSKVINSYLKK